MLIGLIFAALLIASLLAVLWPLARRRAPAGTAPAAGDVAVYEADLVSLERDIAAGRLDAAAAGAVRAEIGRRLIRAARAPAGPPPRSPAAHGRQAVLVAVAVAIFVPAFALLVYLRLGVPELADQPLAARLQQARQGGDIAALVARVEARLQSAPDDGRGWAVIAPVYLRLGRIDDSVMAYRTALRLLGPQAGLEAGLGEALVQASGGVVTAEAEQAFRAAQGLDPAAVKPRFYLAMALTQSGDRAGAVAAWQALLADAPQDAGWVAIARSELASLTASPPPVADVPPGGEDIARMPPAARQEAIRAMVGALDQRLADDGGNVDEWLRLMRARLVLGEDQAARAALGRARAAFAGDAERSRRLETGARDLGLAP
ncbi:c-type cytochrome biogenesis protein CcmI [Pseudoxanthobacter sp.]|uniref:c-type cytochrome biogenesis protein CcmI n=1 Tax=Pseudoxanthobacter sp. TaxID=1925742 RepID=UPI002FE1CAA6